MNKLFVLTGVMLLFVSSFASAAFWDGWFGDKVQNSPNLTKNVATLGPSDEGPISCTSDIRPANVYACGVVQAQEGKFKTIELSNEEGTRKTQIKGGSISLWSTPEPNYGSIPFSLAADGSNRAYIYAPRLSANGLGGYLTIDSYVTDVLGSFNVNASLQVTSLGGSGTAFACLDQYGNLFRSNVSCR